MPRKSASAPVESHLDSICEHLHAGQSLRSYCLAAGINDRTVRSWLARDAEASLRVANARAIGCDALADECIEIADGDDDPKNKRVRVDTRLRLMGKWNQHGYGDKVAHTGADGGAIKLDVESKIDMSGLNDEQLRALASIRLPAS